MKKVLLISLILFSFVLIGCDKQDSQKDKPKEGNQEKLPEETGENKEELPEETGENPNAKISIKTLIGTWEAVRYSRAGKIYEKDAFDKFEATLVIKGEKDAKLNMTTITGVKRELSLVFDLEDIRYLFEYGDDIFDYIFSLKNDILYIYEEEIEPDSIVMDVDCIMFKKVK